MTDAKLVYNISGHFLFSICDQFIYIAMQVVINVMV